MEKNKEMSMDDLALMIQRGFEGVDEKFEKVDKRLENIEGDIVEIKGDIEEMKSDIKILKNGQGDILLRQDSAAQHFEVAAQEKTLEDHGQRIVALEDKVFLAS